MPLVYRVLRLCDIRRKAFHNNYAPKLLTLDLGAYAFGITTLGYSTVSSIRCTGSVRFIKVLRGFKIFKLSGNRTLIVHSGLGLPFMKVLG